MTRAKQDGSITRHCGWWVLRYRARMGVGGVIKTVNRAKRLAPVDENHKTKASVRHLAAEVLDPVRRSPVSPLGVTTLGDFVERLYLPYVKQQKRPSTYNGYSQMWNEYLAALCSATWMREVKTHAVQKWLDDIGRLHRKKDQREYTLSKTTLAHIKNFISGIFRYAAQQGFFDGANPAKLAEIPAFAPRGREGRAYSLQEIDRMLRILPEPAATVVATAAFSGLRLGELRGLMWQSYEAAQDQDCLGVLHVTRSVWRSYVGEPKTERSKAAVPVVRQLEERLNMHRQACCSPASGPIFANSLGKPLDLNALYQRQMKDALIRAGVPWFGWHGFRRGLASNLNQLGVHDSIIQAILRHSDIAVTQRCYIKTTQPEAVEAMKQLSAKISEIGKNYRSTGHVSNTKGCQDEMTLQ